MTNYQTIIAGIVAVLGAISALVAAVGVMIAKIQQLHILINSNLQEMLELNRKAAEAKGQLKGKAEERSDRQVEAIALTNATIAAKEVIEHAACEARGLIEHAAAAAKSILVADAVNPK